MLARMIVSSAIKLTQAPLLTKILRFGMTALVFNFFMLSFYHKIFGRKTMAALKETKELLSLVFALAKTTEKALEDGKLGLDDASLFFGLLPAFGPAFDKISEIPTELGNLLAEDADELVAWVGEEFDLEDDNLEAIIEKSLGVIANVWEVVKLIRG